MEKVDLSKAQAGWTAHFRCGGSAVIKSKDGNLIKFSDEPDYHTNRWYEDGNYIGGKDHPFDIIRLEPPAFDWSTARTGMAFKPTNNPTPDWGIVYLMCESPIRKDEVCVSNDRWFGMGQSTSTWEKSKLQRAEGYDIEVSQ